jgi:hypothetical protein
MPQNTFVDNVLGSKDLFLYYLFFKFVFIVPWNKLINVLCINLTDIRFAVWQAEVFWYRNGESLDFQAFQAKNLTPDSSSVLLQHGDYSDS